MKPLLTALLVTAIIVGGTVGIALVGTPFPNPGSYVPQTGDSITYHRTYAIESPGVTSIRTLTVEQSWRSEGHLFVRYHETENRSDGGWSYGTDEGYPSELAWVVDGYRFVGYETVQAGWGAVNTMHYRTANVDSGFWNDVWLVKGVIVKTTFSSNDLAYTDIALDTNLAFLKA